jgi:hypothetical protein
MLSTRFGEFVSNQLLDRYFFETFRTNKVTCIDKSDDKKDRNDPKKKRPITVMDALGACLERCCAAQFSDFCEKNKGFEDWQHGFRPCRSCCTAFAAFVRGVHTSKYKCTASVFLDGSNAFGAPNHYKIMELLAERIEDKATFDWFKTFYIKIAFPGLTAIVFFIRLII